MIATDSTVLRFQQIKRNASIAFKKLALGQSRPEIKLIVVGAQKGGTTSIYHYLSAHPDIEVPINKEIDYFNSLGNKTGSLQEYQKLFPTRFARKAIFYSVDISPTYLLDAELTAEKIFNLNPEVKIAAVLREPVSRAVSSWFMYKKLHSLNPNWFIESAWVKNNTNKQITRRSRSFGQNFEKDIEDEILVLESGGRIEYPIVEYGLYERQLRHFIDVFGRENLIVLSSVLLKSSTQNCLDQLTSFAGIKTHTLEPHQLVPHFVGDNKQELEASSLAGLSAYYQTQNLGIDEIVGEKFDWGVSKS